MSEYVSGRGGVRAGAGRPKGTKNNSHSERKQRQYRATDEEHELVKRFIAIMRKDFEQAKKLIKIDNKNNSNKKCVDSY